ncbi:MAG: hypothetical protein ABIK28_01465, partial [Planctomycetota bacterium]
GPYSNRPFSGARAERMADKLSARSLSRNPDRDRLLELACLEGWGVFDAAKENPQIIDHSSSESITALVKDLEKAADKRLAVLDQMAGELPEKAGVLRSMKEVYEGQIHVMELTNAPEEDGWLWRRRYLEFGLGGDECQSEVMPTEIMAEQVEQSVELLTRLTSDREAAANTLSSLVDQILEKRRENLFDLSQKRDISPIIRRFCKGRPTPLGIGCLETLMNRSLDKQRDLQRKAFSAEEKEILASKEARMLWLYNLAREIYQVLPKEMAERPDWENEFRNRLHSLEIRFLPLRLLREGSLIKSDSTALPGEGETTSEYQIRLIEEDRYDFTQDPLPSPSSMGLKHYYFPSGTYNCLLTFKKDQGSLCTLIEAGMEPQQKVVYIPSDWPDDRLYIPTPIAGQRLDEGWIFEKTPFSKWDFAMLLLDEKANKIEKLRQESLKLLEAAMGKPSSVGEIKTDSDMKAAYDFNDENRQERVRLDEAGAQEAFNLLRNKINRLSVKNEGGLERTELPSTRVTKLLYLFLRVQGLLPEEITDPDAVRILSNDMSRTRAEQQVHYIIYPAMNINMSTN